MKHIFFLIILYVLITLTWVVASGNTDNPSVDNKGTLKIIINGLKSSNGVVRVVLYNSKEVYENKVKYKINALKIENQQCVWIIPDLPHGEYAITFYHDDNNNKKIDKSMIGMPLESIGFSNNAKLSMGKPAYGEVKFIVGSGITTQNIIAISLMGKGGKLGLGVGVYYKERPYIDASALVIPLPLITYIGKRFSITGPIIMYRLGRSDKMTWGLQGVPRFFGYKENDSPVFEGMEDRGYAYDVGGYFGYRTDAEIDFRLSVVTDLIHVHDGYEIRAIFERNFRLKKWTVTPGIALSWQSENLMNYYYGVPSSEATEFRPEYKLDAVLNGVGIFRWSYKLRGNWMFIGGAELQYLGEEIGNSPLVEKDVTYSVFTALTYWFD